jgi:hypothetical protein
MPPETLLTAAPMVPPTLGRHYGTWRGKSAYARETRAGCWQIKVHDPTHRLAGHDGWLMLGTGWPTLREACQATGLT